MLKTIVVALSLILLSAVGLLLGYPVDHATAAQAESANTNTITVLGYGHSTASADSVNVRLTAGGTSSFYGPEGPEFEPVEEASLEIIRETLINSGVSTETIQTNAFGHSGFDPSATVGEVRFTYDDPASLATFMQELVADLKSARGPTLRGVYTVFSVNDCAMVEAEAMQVALNNARARATQMAAEMGGTLGEMVSVAESANPISFYGTSPVGGCTALEATIKQDGFGSVGLSQNAADGVTVSFMANVTFEIE